MLHEKVGKHGIQNRDRFRVAQSSLNRFYSSCETFQAWIPFKPLNGSVLQNTGHALPSLKKSIITLNLFALHTK